MICCLDVHYRQVGATTAAVLFENWTSSEPASTVVSQRPEVEAYEPGLFYKRELPCLMQAIASLQDPPTLIVIDAHVWLGSRPGLGVKLWEALNEGVPVVGVAKSRWAEHDHRSVPVLRGESGRALWVSAAGIDVAKASHGVMTMHGPHRLPTMIKLADSLCRRPEG